MRAEKFSEILSRAMSNYLKGLLTNEEVIQELLKIAHEIAHGKESDKALDLNDEELAFYDALTKPEAVRDFYTNEQLVAITRELTDALRCNKTIDWNLKESARAGMRRIVKRLLRKYDYPPETILSHTFYRKHPQEFYRFYRDKMLCLDAEPNITHYKLAELEKAGKLKGVVTQNIDGLHQKAGSKNVMELHGSVLRNYCERCLQFVSAEEILHSTDVPKCPKCGGPVRPDVVLYEEGLNQKTLEDAIYYISHADVLIVGGTSLAVYPAAGLIDYYNGNKLVLINKSTTPMDARADLLIQQGLGSVFEQIEV